MTITDDRAALGERNWRFTPKLPRCPTLSAPPLFSHPLPLQACSNERACGGRRGSRASPSQRGPKARGPVPARTRTARSTRQRQGSAASREAPGGKRKDQGRGGRQGCGKEDARDHHPEGGRRGLPRVRRCCQTERVRLRLKALCARAHGAPLDGVEDLLHSWPLWAILAHTVHEVLPRRHPCAVATGSRRPSVSLVRQAHATGDGLGHTWSRC